MKRESADKVVAPLTLLKFLSRAPLLSLTGDFSLWRVAFPLNSVDKELHSLSRMKISTKKITLAFLVVALLALTGSAIYHHLSFLDKDSELFQAYQQDFLALVQKEFSKNTAASEPELIINSIAQTREGLSVNYEIAYTEKFPDGETIQRKTTGVALLKKQGGTEVKDNLWMLQQIKDGKQKLIFSKGSIVGS